MARWRGLAMIVVAAAGLAACASPEATRLRGGGARTGADVNNRSTVVEMHEGSKPYWRTARLIEPYGMDLDGAPPAHRLRTSENGRR
jgi:hypothetical protein